MSTVYGETVKLAGDNAQLGNWATGSAVALSAAQYSSSNPLWTVTVDLPPGTVVKYKFIKVETDGAVVWEADPNHTYTAPVGCATAVAVNDSWQY